MQTNLQGKIKIGSLFILDPTLKPKKAKPEEEEFTDAKIVFFHPSSTDIHEKRKQVGISEGIVSFFLPFTDNQEPVQCISTLSFTHVMKQIEPDLWLNMVLTHPDTLYCGKQDAKEEAETIANTKFQVSLFREEDAKIFHKLLDVYYKYFTLFHGNMRDLWLKSQKEEAANYSRQSLVENDNQMHSIQTLSMFEQIMEDFTRNFDQHFFTREYEKNFFWNLSFQGLFYCPIEKKQFLQTQLLVNSLLLEYQDVQHVLVFHEEFYISSTLPHENIQTLYSYLIGCGESTRDKRKIKIFTYKEAGKMQKVTNSVVNQVDSTRNSGNNKQSETQQDQESQQQQQQDSSSSQSFQNISLHDLIEQEDMMGISNFCKINGKMINQPYNPKNMGFIIGPQFPVIVDTKIADLFAPKIFIKNQETGQMEPYRMLVFQGQKMLVTMLFKVDYQFTYSFLASLNNFLCLHTPTISQQLDQIVSKVFGREDPVRFVYFNHMNLAFKLSNLITKEVFTQELILTLNQIHDNFVEDPDCVEQHMNNSFYWIVGINSQGREIYLIFPPNYSSAKVELEKKKVLAGYFQNLFL